MANAIQNLSVQTDIRIDNERVALVAMGYSVPRSSLLLCSVFEDGYEKVKLSTGSADDIIVGFSEVFDGPRIQDGKIERLMIPTVEPFELDISRSPLLGYGPDHWDMRVTAVSGRPFQQNIQVGAGRFYSNGRGAVQFSESDSGTIVDIAYRHLLSSQEAHDLIVAQESSSSYVVGQIVGRVMVLGGLRQIFTREFDRNSDFSSGTLRSGVDGQVTTSGAGADLSKLMRVIKLPDGQDGLLGLALQIPV